MSCGGTRTVQPNTDMFLVALVTEWWHQWWPVSVPYHLGILVLWQARQSVYRTVTGLSASASVTL